MAAFLSGLMQVVIWVAIVCGIIAFLLISVGLIGSLNGGVMRVPGMEAYVEGVAPGQFIAGLAGLVVFAPGIIYVCAVSSRPSPMATPSCRKTGRASARLRLPSGPSNWRAT